MPKRIKLGILGGGGDSLIGIVHRIAAYMHDDYEIIGGVFNPDKAISLEFAEEIDIPTNRIYATVEEPTLCPIFVRLLLQTYIMNIVASITVRDL